MATPNQDIEQLSVDVDACFDTPLSCLSDEELSERLVLLVDVSARVDALRVETVRAASVAGVPKLNDQRNVANHVGELTNTNPADIRKDQLIADWLVDFATLAEAYQAGKLTTAHIDLLRRKDNARVHQQMIDDQTKFVRWFSSLAFRDLDHLMERWLLGADPDGAAPEEQLKKCHVTTKPLPGGMLALSAIFDPLSGAAFLNALNAEAEKVRQENKAEGITSPLGHRNLQALMRLVITGASRPGRATVKPLINIAVDQDTYEETLGWLDDPSNNPLPTPQPEPPKGADRRCHLIDGTPIHPAYAVIASAKGVFRRIVYDAKSRELDASFDSRSFPQWITDLVLIATNGKSANPVCDAPFHWLQTDHIEPDSLGGQTTLDNARPLSAGDNGWRGNDISRGRWPMPD